MILAFALSSFVGVVEHKLLGWKLAGR